MRLINSNETLDAPYEQCVLHAYKWVGNYAITVDSVNGEGIGAPFAEFDSEAEALREMRRIRRAYEAGAKFYIIGTGDHDGPMEVGR